MSDKTPAAATQAYLKRSTLVEDEIQRSLHQARKGKLQQLLSLSLPMCQYQEALVDVIPNQEHSSKQAGWSGYIQELQAVSPVLVLFVSSTQVKNQVREIHYP